MVKAKKNPGGRPREIEAPYRLNLLVEAEFASDLGRLARHASLDAGKPVSIARALSEALKSSGTLDARRSARRRLRRRGKLPDAIRRGSKLHDETGLNVYFERRGGKVVGSSSLGAAWVACGMEPDRLTTSALYRLFPELTAPREPACPAKLGCRNGRNLEAHVIHLEDRHGWSREKIADWLEAQGL